LMIGLPRLLKSRGGRLIRIGIMVVRLIVERRWVQAVLEVGVGGLKKVEAWRFGV
jgi:hypothetical protein